MHHLNHSLPDFNTALNESRAKSGPALRQRFLRLGVELHHRGSRPVAEFVSELADLAPNVVAEVQARLEAYCRIDAATYAAVGADTFRPYIVAFDGGRNDTP